MLFVVNIFIIFSFVLYYINIRYEKYNDYNIKTFINYKDIINKKILFIDKINLSKEIAKAEPYFKNLDENIVYYDNFNINNKIIIFGHSGNAHNAYFKRLKDLSLNDEAIIYNNGIIYNYVVTNIYMIDEYDTYILSSDINSKKLLLITCDETYSNKRLVVEFILKTL